ncbi:MAG TPA: M28 family metallopeptidase [Pyrinomonadaceae bacterium]|nr:M28 family metallopeptidase [Pyrinomonadaceae bacterium]
MRLALYRLTNNSQSTQANTSRRARSSAAASATPTASWARFGDEVLVYADEADTAKLAFTETGRAARRVSEDTLALKRDQMHVVVQNGRMFQQENPRVPVLLDKGRYLLVKLDPRRARQLREASPTCYGMFPLRENQVVFDVRDAASARAAKVAWVNALVQKVERNSFASKLSHLVSFQTRHSTGSGFRSASTWAREQLKALDYVTRFQNISVNGKPSRNLIADKAGLGPAPRKVVLVTAHLDSVNLSGGPSAPAPGADDNGSGSAGLLEMARAFAAHPSVHDVRLILFGGEEQGLFGSLHYVSSLSQTARQRVLSVLNMDMIGTLNTPTRSVMLEGAPLSQRLIDGLATAAATYTSLKVETSLNPFASDHVPFIKAGVPAVLTIEGADNTNSNIHSSRDTLDHINHDFAVEILRMNVAFIAGEIGRKV